MAFYAPQPHLITRIDNTIIELLTMTHLTPPDASPTLHVAFGVDDNYCRGMGVMITSMVKHNPNMHFVFHVFAFTISPNNEDRIQRLSRLLKVDIQIHLLNPTSIERFNHLPYYGQYPLGTITRLLIPNALSSITDSVLYVDADILCFGDLQSLVNMDIDDIVAAVVTDEANTTVATQIDALKLPIPEYFNAGVMYINNKKWLALDIETETLTTLFSRQLRFIDQDVLNLALNGKTRYLPTKWNHRYHLVDYLSRGERTLTLPKDLVFMHFTGPVKPWQNWCIHEAKEHFLKFQAESTWCDMPLDAPKKVNELKLVSKFLIKQGKISAGILWHMQYLTYKLLNKK
jgi:lipopolysaccharide biosynthesis glycosyltransferase